MSELNALGYSCEWKLLSTHHFGVSQLRPRAVLIALKRDYVPFFTWPLGIAAPPLTVGQLLYKEISQNGWQGAKAWAEKANGIAPTLVGGSKKHGARI